MGKLSSCLEPHQSDSRHLFIAFIIRSDPLAPLAVAAGKAGAALGDAVEAGGELVASDAPSSAGEWRTEWEAVGSRGKPWRCVEVRVVYAPRTPVNYCVL